MSNVDKFSLKEFRNGTAREFIYNQLKKADAGLEEDSFDSFGADLETLADTFTVFFFMYQHYFRVEAHGVENLPQHNEPGLMVSNHAPILPIDACMLCTAALVEPEQPRLPRTIVNRAIADIPFFSVLLYRCGQIIGCDDNVRRIFEEGNLVLVFPTGAEGQVHSIFNKYHLDQFTLGFMEYSLKYNTPIIPTCVTGSEEAAMTLAGIDLPMGGFKHFPITPIFPWFGLLGLIPFPSKFNIYFEKPVHYYKDHAKDIDDPAKVREIVDDLHSRIRAMLDNALEK